MDISFYLAKVLGPYLFIMALVLYASMRKIKTMMNEINVPFFMFVSGAKSLLFGLLIVACHSFWVADWKVLITIIGWLLIIRGIMRLFFPEKAYEMIKKIVSSSTTFYSIAFITLIVGAYLSYMGYIVHMT